ncbi:MAG TPA: diguanylate cyclase [Candidatus Omnitrophota bacterium]|nr:diguanylate cyclase [Candidatus Omnitrophota bacterium]
MDQTESVLVIEDDRILCQHLKAGLSEAGYDVVAVNKGGDAVDQIHKRFFNVVVLDLVLPDIQGIELMRLFSKKNPETCFVVSTGYATISSAIEALKVGAYDYIVKPFDIDHLRLVIRRGLDKQHLVFHNQQLLAQMEKEKVKLEIVMDAYTRMSGIYRLDDLADFVTEQALNIVEAERASLMLVDATTNELVLKGAKGIAREKVAWRVKIGDTIAGWVAKQGEILLVKDIDTDSRVHHFARNRQYKTRSFVSLPLKIDTQVIGVMSVTDKLASAGIFTETDLRYLSLLAHQTVAQIENIRLCETLGSLAITDSLTGVFNHRYFQEQLAVEVMRAQRYKHSLSLMMFDVDHFKSYNDRFGHLEGDRVLKHVAWVMRDNVRQVDIVCRYGGDEFVVILPYTDVKGTFTVAEKIRKTVEKQDFFTREGQKKVPLSLSCGIATFHSGLSKDELISHVDQALYKAKAEGKNTTRIFE